MNSKKLLTLVLAFCLMLSVLSPAASAVQVGPENSVAGSTQGENVSAGSNRNDLVVSHKDSAASNSLRDQANAGDKEFDISLVNGQWIATSVDGVSVVLTDAELPDYIQALRKAAEYYSTQDKVAAFVVLEDAPTVEQYSSISEVPAAETEYLSEQQDALISTIEEEVLEGDELNVITQFTYLTNSVVVETEFGNLEAIASLDGVKSVFLSPVYEACEVSNVTYPATVSSVEMSSVAAVWQDLGYTGAGMTIAVLDTGLDLDHPSFAADPEGASWDTEWLQEMLDNNDLNCEALYSGTLTADKLYYSAKVPFTFNYALGNTNVSHADGLGDHGTHVAGIAAANDVEGSGVVGMAPDAQIIVMKVFNSTTGGSNMYDLITALEDCLTLGVDVVNMSLGSAAGFCESNIEEIDSIFQRIAETDIVVDVAAGNEGTSAYGSLYGNYMNTTENIDNATISSPSTYVNSMSIASVNNNYVYTAYFTLADGSKVFYMQSVEYLYEYISYSLEILADNELEYVVVDGLGAVEDFYDEDGNSLVEGKVAVVKRGELTFAEKSFNAEAAGAVALLIWDNVSEDIYSFGMTTSDTDEYGNEIYPSIPVVLITLEDGQTMADAETKTLTPAAEMTARYDVGGGQMSSFSCWGVAPDLGLLPDITGVGGNVYSCYDGGNYGLMSGTSMATPQVAGVTALVLQYLHEKFPNATNAEIRTLVDSLMMSTAVPVIDSTTGLEASPRQQGAGFVNALAAISAEAYLTVSGSDRPKAELGDNTDGTYSFTFTVHNFSNESKTYTLSSSLLCEDYAEDDLYPGVYFMAESEHALDNSAVSFSKNSVTVAAGATATVTVTIDLTKADKDWIDTYFPNGNYVEGFVYLTDADEEGAQLSLPFLGFYGEWDDAPVFDTGYWYDNGFWEVGTEVEANQFYHMLWTSLGYSEGDWVLGFNPYAGETYEYDESGDPVNVVYDSKNNVLSPNGDGLLDQISDMYLSLMRNAKCIYLTYTDADGNVLDVEELEYNPKTMYNSTYEQTVPFVYSWYYDSPYDFTDADGNYLPNGSVVYLTISGVIAYDGAEEDVMDEIIPIYIDTVAPVLGDEIVESTDEEGNHYLTLTIAEEHPAYVVLTNRTGTQVYNTYSDADMTDNGDGTYSVTVDVTGRGDNFNVALCDYGCNESTYSLTWSESGANDPEVDYDALYAYQVYNEYIDYYYGYDFMFGWSTIDKATADVTMLQSDAYEYYALNAAEYAGGYVFAVDAGYNFLYMTPGLWDRNLICNIGINVLDMAFDETTDTMYLLAHDTESGYYSLYTVDLLTGELTILKSYSSYYFAPWAMTFVDGKLYCCKYYYNGLFQVDIEGGTYDLSAVKDAEGNTFYPKTSSGSNTSPAYSQSMTYSAADGVIYWAYYGNDAYDLITIDPVNWTSSAVSFAFDQEYVGLLTLEDDGYTIPESDEVTKMVISDEQLIMAAGMSGQLSVTMLPWNAPVTEDVVWSSDNEAVATVDENGNVTAVSEGTAIITATYGDLSVSCAVAVVNVSGSLNAYKYFDGNSDFGYWLNIDLETVTEEATVTSPVDFIAADYNGHDGKIYGYDEFGQCYCFDPATGECDTLGVANINLVPEDLAYDYSTGLMYAINYDFNTGSTTLYTLNMSSGKLVEVAVVYDIYLTLACDTEGLLYAVNSYGELYELQLMEDTTSDDGDDGWIDDDWWGVLSIGANMGMSSTDVPSYYIYPNYIMQTPVAEPYYAQTMCYDHNNDVLLWINPEYSTIYWIDGLDSDYPFAVSLGDPSGSGLIQYVGAYVIPDDIPELEYIPVSAVEGEDMMVLTGGTKAPDVTVYPTNATNQAITEWSSTDSDVAYVDENGLVVGVSAGSATIYATVVDVDEDGTEHWFDAAFTVTVKNSTDNIYGHLMTDIATYDGYYWISIDDEDPVNYQGVEYIYSNGVYMLLYAAEYVDGIIYAYGYDYNDWYANFHYLTIDAETWAVLSDTDMGDSFPFIYDMAFDYTTGTMYALAGPSDNSTDLYYVNMENGQLIECMLTDPMFMSLAIDGDGTIYAMAAGELIYDWELGYCYSSAILYTLDVDNGTYDVFMDTGYPSASLSSMAYDYDTGYIYWTGLVYDYMFSIVDSGFYLIDPADMTCNKLGTVGSAGAQVTALMVIADEYPELPDSVQKLAVLSSVEELSVGDSVALETMVLPVGIEVGMSWSSEDESVATVDENGVITAVAPGTTTVTVTVVDGDVTLTASCTIIVYGKDDFFITYNTTDGGFATIARPDSTIVTNLTEGETEAAVTAMAMVNGYIYAYDEENNLFITSVGDEFQRTYLGNAGIEVEEPYSTETVYSTYTYCVNCEYTFVIRDMVWDEANDRLLALGCYGMTKDNSYIYSDGYTDSYTDVYEQTNGCRIFEVDTATGALTELLVVGGEYGESGVSMLAMDGNGQAYIYSYLYDYVCQLDMETGELTYLTTFQNQGVYGSGNGDLMAMTYDAVTDCLYLLFTENGNTYSLYQFNIGTGALTLVDNVGEIAYEDYVYSGDAFAGLVLNETHVCEYGLIDSVDATCTEDGYETYECPLCGNTYTMTIEAAGHCYEVTETVDATCTEDGYETYRCPLCGNSYTETIEATGHTYVDGKCDCGAEEPESQLPASGDSFAEILLLLLPLSLLVIAVVVLNRKKFLDI